MDKKLLMFILVGLLAVGIIINIGIVGGDGSQSWTYKVTATETYDGGLSSYDKCDVTWKISLSNDWLMGSVTMQTDIGNSKTLTEPNDQDTVSKLAYTGDSTTASVVGSITQGSYTISVSVTNCKNDELSCTSTCANKNVGDKECDGSKIKTCEQQGDCKVWSNPVNCPIAGQTCKNNQCQAVDAGCTSHASYTCKQGTTQIWYKNSCGEWEGLKLDCGAAGCSGQTCNSVQQDTCTSKGFKCCSACTTGTEKSDFYLNCKPKFCCSSCAQTEENTCSDNWGRDHKGASRKDSGTFQACCDGSWETIAINK